MMQKVNINNGLWGAIAGDVVGSIYEFCPTKDYQFPLIDKAMEYTDDSIITIAVADWILSDPHLTRSGLTKKMRFWGNKYPHPMGAYGPMFAQWLSYEGMRAYNSCGNGSAMRVSPVGFAFDTLQETLRVAQVSAEVTHNHPEGIKGAQATAAAIFMARTGQSKQDIKTYLERNFGYDLSYSTDDIRDTYSFDGTCQGTVPQSIVAFLQSTNYEDAIRLTVSLGGDADTMGAITGAIAAAYYKEMPSDLLQYASNILPADLRAVVDAFGERVMV